MALEYRLKNGSYCLYDMGLPPSRVTGEHPLKLRTDVVSIAFDALTGQLHDHGSPSFIRLKVMNMRHSLKRQGAIDEANRIVVVTGPLPVEEVNKCLHITGYCRRMFRRLAQLPHGKLGTRARESAQGFAQAKAA